MGGLNFAVRTYRAQPGHGGARGAEKAALLPARLIPLSIRANFVKDGDSGASAPRM